MRTILGQFPWNARLTSAMQIRAVRSAMLIRSSMREKSKPETGFGLGPWVLGVQTQRPKPQDRSPFNIPAMPHLRSLKWKGGAAPERTDFPFGVPAIQSLESLSLAPAVT